MKLKACYSEWQEILLFAVPAFLSTVATSSPPLIINLWYCIRACVFVIVTGQERDSHC